MRRFDPSCRVAIDVGGRWREVGDDVGEIDNVLHERRPLALAWTDVSPRISAESKVEKGAVNGEIANTMMHAATNFASRQRRILSVDRPQRMKL